MQLEHMPASKLAVIGDVHSNFLALKASLQSISEYEASVSPVDIIIFIGDLLTYGVFPDETLCELFELLSRRQTVFVMGNHDQLYIDLISGYPCEYYTNLPQWIKESVDHNLSKLDQKMLLGIKFVPYYIHSSTVFSHANFSTLASGLFNWNYVNTLDDHLDQLKIISHAGYTLGVLGHTHRARCYSLSRIDAFEDLVECANRKIQLDTPIKISGGHYSILNAGSIGQPRDRSYLDPSWLLIEFDDLSNCSAKYISFGYDVDEHLNSIVESGLSANCIRKLISFF